jgi:hypothetical protein
MGVMRNTYKMLVRKPEGKKQLVRSRSRKKDNVRMNLREIGRESVDWMHLAQDRDQWCAVINTVMDIRVL